MSLRSQDKAADFTATVEAGLKANAQNANLEKLLYAYCMKKGQAAQKAGKTEEAEELFKDVLVVGNAKYKGNALYSLGVMFYNAGAKILQMPTRSQHPILINTQLKRKKQMLKWQKPKVTWSRQSL